MGVFMLLPPYHNLKKHHGPHDSGRDLTVVTFLMLFNSYFLVFFNDHFSVGLHISSLPLVTAESAGIVTDTDNSMQINATNICINIFKMRRCEGRRQELLLHKMEPEHLKQD